MVSIPICIASSKLPKNQGSLFTAMLPGLAPRCTGRLSSRQPACRLLFIGRMVSARRLDVQQLLYRPGHLDHSHRAFGAVDDLGRERPHGHPLQEADLGGSHDEQIEVNGPFYQEFQGLVRTGQFNAVERLGRVLLDRLRQNPAGMGLLLGGVIGGQNVEEGNFTPEAVSQSPGQSDDEVEVQAGRGMDTAGQQRRKSAAEGGYGRM